jgi:hypothetical protein
MPGERWNELFAGLRSDRDRAILALGISTGARAGELLGVRGCDLDWGEQLVRVCRKGSGAEQWLPASPEAFVWIRLYLAGLDPLEPHEPVWWTLRRRDHGDGLRRQPVNYEALRAVFRRVNVLLGTNYSMHDLRHTAALRMKRRGVALNATFRRWREDGAVRDGGLGTAGRRSRRRSEPAGQDSRDRTVLHQVPRCCIHSGCTRCTNDAAKETKNRSDEGRCRYRPVARLTHSAWLVNRSLPVAGMSRCPCGTSRRSWVTRTCPLPPACTSLRTRPR